MSDYLKKYSRNSIMISVLLIILSLFLIFNPSASLALIMVAVGVVLGVNGVIHIVSYFSSPKELQMFSFELTWGVLSLIFGLVFIFNPNIINTFLSIIIGAWIILQSINSIQLSLSMKGNTKHWFVVLIVAIVTLLIGVVMLFNPFTASAVVMAGGIMLLIFEIINIAETAIMMYYMK